MINTMRFSLAFLLLCVGIHAAPAKPQAAYLNDDVKNRINPGLSFAPIVGYGPTYGVIFGGAAFRGVPTAPYSDASAQLFATTKGHFQGQLAYKLWDKNRSFYFIETIVTTFFDPYFGEGSKTNPNGRTDIDAFKINLNPSYGYRLSNTLTLGAYALIKERDETGVGGNKAARIFGSEFRSALGVSFSYDGRDNQIFTRNGQYASVAVDTGPALLSTKAGAKDFTRLEVDLRNFFPLADWLVLGQQVRAGTATGDPGFLYRFALGGSDTIRGYQTNRMRGNHYYLGQLEARFFLLNWLGFTVFGSMGDVGDQRLADFTSPRFAKGFGLRFGLPPDLVAKARIDFGIADDQSSFYLVFNEAF